MTDTDPDNDGTEDPDRPSDDSLIDRPTAEAKRYLRRVADQPNDVREEQARIIELLSTGDSSASNREKLERRATASCTLAKLAREVPSSVADSLPTLVEELRIETGRELSAGRPETRAGSRRTRDRLVRTVAYIIVSRPRTATEADGFADFGDAVTIDLDERTLRVASKALFASADERSAELASATELLSELSPRLMTPFKRGPLERSGKWRRTILTRWPPPPPIFTGFSNMTTPQSSTMRSRRWPLSSASDRIPSFLLSTPFGTCSLTRRRPSNTTRRGCSGGSQRATRMQ
jgi:hypothetical protein